MKVIKLKESDLRRIIKRIISDQKKVGTNQNILNALSEMSFEKQNCKGFNPETEELSYEFCNKTRPEIVVFYTSDGGLELLNISEGSMGIIKTWENFTEQDIPELEIEIKNIL